jgi:hypothetical protein
MCDRDPSLPVMTVVALKSLSQARRCCGRLCSGRGKVLFRLFSPAFSFPPFLSRFCSSRCVALTDARHSAPALTSFCSYDDNARRELSEEMGIPDGTPLRFVTTFKHEDER